MNKPTSSSKSVSSGKGDVPHESEARLLESLSLLNLLKDFTNRLEILEKTISKQKKSGIQTVSDFIVEVLRIIFGGWAAFGFLFLLLFYTPLDRAISSIPDKVQSSNEIQVLGVSLKSTIRTVATSRGLEKLAETIPNLSSRAVKELLKAPKEPESLISFTNTADKRSYSAINFPAGDLVNALAELQRQGLISLDGGLSEYKQKIEAQELKQMFTELKDKFPGSAKVRPGHDKVSWELNDAIPDKFEPIPRLTWMLTDSGKQSADVILEAISRELVQDERT